MEPPQAAPSVEASESGTSTRTLELTEANSGAGVDSLEATELEPGARVGRYVIAYRLGEGGMSRVYLAEDPELERRVAIKVLRAPARDSKGFRRTSARLLREAQAIARLSHPNVVSVFDVGRFEDGVFIAMEYVEGRTIRDWLAEQTRSLEEILDAFIDVGRALEAAHESGIVHRDIKPENILVDQRGRVRVLDFGLARASLERVPDTDGSSDSRPRSDSLLSASMTLHGHIVGTPAYMSPEQARGEPTTGATDQFSLCVALFEAALGQRPFRGRSIRELGEARKRGPKFPPDVRVRVDLRALLDRGLATEPSERFVSMSALIAAMQRVRFRRRRVLVRMGAVAGLVSTAVAGWAVSGGGPDPCRDTAQFEAWGPPQRESLREVFESSPSIEGAGTWTLVSSTLTRYGDQWSAARLQVCTEALEGTQTGVEMDLRVGCLHRHQQVFDALVDTLSHGGPEIVARAPSLAAELPPIAQCSDIAALRRLPPVPSDPALRARTDEARAGLAEAAARRKAGRFHQATSRLDRLRSDLVDLDVPPVLAEYELEQARLQAAQSQFSEAEVTLRQALSMAERATYPSLRAEILIELGTVLGAGLKRFEAGREALASAEAVLVGLDRPPGLVARLEIAQGDLLYAGDRYPAARERFEAALGMNVDDIPRDEILARVADALVDFPPERMRRYQELLELRRERYGENHPGVADALMGIGKMHNHARKLDLAHKAFEEAMEIRKKVFGAQSLPVAQAYSSLGVVAIHRGDHPRAIELISRGLQIAEAAPEHPDFDVTNLQSNLAIVYSRDGDQERAREMHHRSLDTITRVDPEHPRRVIPTINIAMTYQREERWEEAIEWFQRAESIFVGMDSLVRAGHMALAMGDIYLQQQSYPQARDTFRRARDYLEIEPPKKLGSANSVLGIAQAQSGMGDHEAALETARSLLAHLDEHGLPSPRHRAAAHLTIADAEWEIGDDQSSAFEAAQQARAETLKMKEADDISAAIDEWIAEHPVPG